MNERRDDVAIAVDGLSVAYRTDAGLTPAVRGVSFSLAPSESLAIVGESGSGKSTLATALAGLLPAHIAEIGAISAHIGNEAVDVTASASVIPTRRDGVSMVFQDAMTSLDPVASIAHQFRTVLRDATGARGKKWKAEAAAWIGKVGIHEPERVLKLRPYELSGGMRQRVMIALALCGRPKALIADEPTSALDASVSRKIMDLTVALTEELGTALIIITHDIDLAREYTDKTLVLLHGTVQDLCRTDELYSPERSPYTQELMRCVPRLRDHDSDVLPTLAIDLPKDLAA